MVKASGGEMKNYFWCKLNLHKWIQLYDKRACKTCNTVEKLTPRDVISIYGRHWRCEIPSEYAIAKYKEAQICEKI
jgi:hypothetical protein